VTTNDDFEGDPAWSPDGKRLAFTRITGMGTDAIRGGIMVMNADGSGAKQLTQAPRQSVDATPTWSPDGSLLAFTRAFLTEDGALGVFVVAPDGTGIEQVASGGGDPAWSPDGDQIAYASIRDRFGETCFHECSTSGEIYLMDAEGGNDRRLTRTEADDGSPAWSPDGRQIAFVSDRANREEHANEIYVMDAAGDDVRRITRNQVWDLEPAWRPKSSAR
jgi:Tol biopolymer transport system component